jgi:hypothetical protein
MRQKVKRIRRRWTKILRIKRAAIASNFGVLIGAGVANSPKEPIAQMSERTLKNVANENEISWSKRQKSSTIPQTYVRNKTICALKITAMRCHSLLRQPQFSAVHKYTQSKDLFIAPVERSIIRTNAVFLPSASLWNSHSRHRNTYLTTLYLLFL